MPGEDLPGSVSATEFVSWYSGHPDADVDGIALTATSVAVIGAGNVALDVARMLLTSVERLRATDVPEHVLKELADNPVRDVYILARRGIAQAKFSSKELHDIGELADVDVMLRQEDAHLDGSALDDLNGDPARHQLGLVLGLAELRARRRGHRGPPPNPSGPSSGGSPGRKAAPTFSS